MKRRLDRKEVAKWRASVGGLKIAAQLIQERLECSFSKAAKIAAGRYPSLVSPAEQYELSDLMGRPRDVLFKLIGVSRKRAPEAALVSGY
jgi:hypothetical protein